MDYADNLVDTPFNEEEELAALDNFEDSVSLTTSLINRLMATKKAFNGANTLKAAIDDLAEHSTTNPDEDYSSPFIKLETRFEELSRLVGYLTIPSGNRIHQDIQLIQNKRHALNLGKGRPVTLAGRPSMAVPGRPKTMQLPKLHLPTFGGDLIDWAPFWAQFRTTVDLNPELSSEHKLAYLRDAIKDPSVKSLMFSGAE